MDELSQICEAQLTHPEQWKGRPWHCDCFPDQSVTLAVFPILVLLLWRGVRAADWLLLTLLSHPFLGRESEMALLGFRVWGTGRQGKIHFPKAVVTRPRSHRAKQKEP